VNVRKQAVEGLIKKHTKAAQALLVKALTDADKTVRQAALAALVSDDARPALTEALTSPHDDIRVRAGQALAKHGEPVALAPLLTLANVPEPSQRERVGDWQALVVGALSGLAELGDPAALPTIMPLLQSLHADIRKAAATALSWVAVPHHAEALRQALQHNDNAVKYRAALGLAYAGDPLVAALVFSKPAAEVLGPAERLTAALLLGPAGADQLVTFLDDANEHLRNRALLILLLLELRDPRPTPERILAGLSSSQPRVRLTAARALEVVNDAPAFAALVVQLFNDRGDETAWKIAADDVLSVASLLAHGPPTAKARTTLLLAELEQKEQAAWDAGWHTLSQRLAKERKAIVVPPAPKPYPTDKLLELAFGAYVGLTRLQTGATPAAVRVRQTALDRLRALAEKSAHFKAASAPVLTQALGDSVALVRLRAFEHLHALGTDPTQLGAEALATGHLDLGVKGLELLAVTAGGAAGQAVLEQALLTRTDELAGEAAKLLSAQRGQVAVAVVALEAAQETLRSRAISWLASAWDETPAARDHLRAALDSRFARVRLDAALELAQRKDAAAFDPLIRALSVPVAGVSNVRVLAGLAALNDPRTPDALIDRVENDPAGTAPADLLKAAGAYRLPAVAERLLKIVDSPSKRRGEAATAVLTISGFDQRIENADEELPPNDPDWEKKQHPRHLGVLARLLEVALKNRDVPLLKLLLPGVRWAKGKEVEPFLATLSAHPDDGLRRDAVEALGWRLRKRAGSADALVKCLTSKDGLTAFAAAEGLARAGRAEGLNVLLAGVDLLPDAGLQSRAVLALGELGDVRALDVLLKHANDEASPLQTPAATAIGHLGQSPQAGAIFDLLARLVQKPNRALAGSAITGLRWLNTPAAWTLIRQVAQTLPVHTALQAAVLMLAHDDTAEGRQVLLRLCAHEPIWATAYSSARKLLGPDSLEPDYAVLRNPHRPTHADSKPLERVCAHGAADRIFDLLPHVQPNVFSELTTTLLNREPLALTEAGSALASSNYRPVLVAARIIGRVGSPASAHTKAVGQALTHWQTEWTKRRATESRDGRQTSKELGELTACVGALLYAAGRLGLVEAVLAAAADRPDDLAYRPVRQAAAQALAALTVSATHTPALVALAQTGAVSVRPLAAHLLTLADRPAAERVVSAALTDHATVQRVVLAGGQVSAALPAAAQALPTQGVALPLLVAAGDLRTLLRVAEDTKLPEVVRQGALEALAKLSRTDAEAELVRIGKTESVPEELRKTAWRGVKRSRRVRAKVAKLAGAANV
jgi:ParB family chromosome partitioning protein